MPEQAYRVTVPAFTLDAVDEVTALRTAQEMLRKGAPKVEIALVEAVADVPIQPSPITPGSPRRYPCQDCPFVAVNGQGLAAHRRFRHR